MTHAPRLDRYMPVLLAAAFSGAAGMSAMQGLLSDIAALWIVFVLAFGAYMLAIPALLRQAYGRVLLVFLPLLFLAVLLVMSLVAFAGVSIEMASNGLIGGTIVAFGWLVTYLVTNYRETVTRARQQRETLIALRSEIFALVDKLDNQPIADNAEQVQKKILAGGPDGDGGAGEYFPFSTMDSTPIVFDAVAASIPALRADVTVQSIIRFYAEYSDMRQLIEDSRPEKLLGMSRARRVGLHKELTRRRISTLRWGLQATYYMNVELDIPAPANIRRSGKNPKVKL